MQQYPQKLELSTQAEGLANPERDHRPQLDTLRCIAFLVVFLYHVRLSGVTGCHGVWLFFAISGFVITRRLLLGGTGKLAHDLKVFYARRTLRIWPLYYLFLAVTYCCGLLPDPAWYLTFTVNILFALMAQWPPDTGVGVCWSLGVEEQFYLIYPLMLLLTSRRFQPAMLLTLIGSSIILRIVLYSIIKNGFSDMLLPVVGQFLLWGSLAAWWDINGGAKRFSAGFYIIVGFVLVAGYYVTDHYQIFKSLWDWCMTLKMHVEHVPHTLLFSLNALGNAMIVLGVWRLKNAFWLKIFSFPPLVYLGKISYCMYLIHCCILIELNKLGWFPFREEIIKIALLLLTIGIASLSWYFFEKPINDLKRYFPYGDSGDKTPRTDQINSQNIA